MWSPGSKSLTGNFEGINRSSRWRRASTQASPQWMPTELSPNFGDGRSRSGGGGCGLTVGRLGDDLDPVVECHTKNEFWQLVGAVETAPAFLRGFQQFEDHRERGPVGQAALRSDRAVAHGGEGAFNGVGGP